LIVVNLIALQGLLVNVLVVALGGAVGSVLRFLISFGVHAAYKPSFPYATVGINVTGCLLIGFAMVAFAGPYREQETLRTALMVGVLGGFTTFSSFSLETMNLVFEGRYERAMLNVGVSVALGLLATWAGVRLAHAVYGAAAVPPAAT
jgi:fluoride exporter